MTNPEIIEHNISDDSVIMRPFNKDEMVMYNNNKLRLIEDKAEAEAKATARQAILDRLGLTADEAKLLLG
jgi:hypothetical protein